LAVSFDHFNGFFQLFNPICRQLGSLNHLGKYGGDVTTEIVGTYQTKQKLKEAGIYYSQLWDIVESSEWANLKEECGHGSRNKTMTTKQYLAILRKLGLLPYGQSTAIKLGVGISTLSNYAVGEHIPTQTAQLLRALLKIQELEKELQKLLKQKKKLFVVVRER